MQTKERTTATRAPRATKTNAAASRPLTVTLSPAASALVRKIAHELVETIDDVASASIIDSLPSIAEALQNRSEYAAASDDDVYFAMTLREIKRARKGATR